MKNVALNKYIAKRTLVYSLRAGTEEGRVLPYLTSAGDMHVVQLQLFTSLPMSTNDQ